MRGAAFAPGRSSESSRRLSSLRSLDGKGAQIPRISFYERPSIVSRVDRASRHAMHAAAAAYCLSCESLETGAHNDEGGVNKLLRSLFKNLTM